MKKITFLFAFFLSLFGGTQAWADILTEGFSSSSSLPEGWELKGQDALGTPYSLTSDYNKPGSSGDYCLGTSSTSTSEVYVITPKVTGTVTIPYRKWASGSGTSNIYIYEYTDEGSVITSTSLGRAYSTATSWDNITIELGSKETRLAIIMKKAVIDDFTADYVLNIEGPAFRIANFTDGDSFGYGMVNPGTTKEFTLKNPGTESVTVNITTTGGFVSDFSNVTIGAKGQKTVTVTVPDESANGTVKFTPTAVGLGAITINLSCVIKDPNKVYLDFSDGSMPDGWTSVAIGSYASSYGTPWTASTGYVGQSGTSSSYEWAFTSPKMVFSENETIIFETQKYTSSTWYNPSITVQYKTEDGEWTTVGSTYTDDTYDTWTKRSVTIPTADAKYIRFTGWYVKLKNIYGGELPLEPRLSVTQPTSLDFGLLDKDATPATKTFTIANTGRATLNGISVSSANAAFTVTGAPSSLAAGASQEVTITMDTGTTGALSSDIKVSATGMDDVDFTVTGVVMPAGAFVVDFNDNALPSGWTNASWTFANGKATGKSFSAYLTTPKLIFSEGDFLVLKARRTDSDVSDYLTVQGSNDNGETWTAYSNKLQNAQGLTYPDWGTIVLTDIPTTVNKLRFVGYYSEIDEITGLTYAPVLFVTKDAAAVTTPAAYDFGECGANATVTYNFANTGAGTISITNVAITGTGADAYSTNWSASVAAPFDLKITRTYDAERAGAAQDAVVTVTTSEGDFVINVTGTDLAADAPTMGVTLGGAAVATGAAADFGTKLKAAPAAKTYTITNTGTGTLTGTIATSDDTKFTVSKTSFSLAASESTTFDLALVFDTSYGDKAATITIHPTVAGLDDVVINATATTMDPETWEEDFEGGVLPTGWIITPGSYSGNTYAWHIGTFSDYENKTNMAIAPTSTTSNSIVTPRLAAKRDDVLNWDAYFNWYDESLTVEWSHDGATEWTTIYNYKPEDESISARNYHKSMSFTAPADGNYYLRFTSRYSNGVDNFAGFKLNIPDHIMSITASSIPTSNSYSPTMKIGKSFDATVTVRELRGVAETGVVAKLYMGDDVIGTSTSTDFEANETKKITISCTPTVAAPSGAKMHIEVEYAGEKLATAEETRYVADLNLLTLDETSASESLATGTYDVVTLKRTFVAGWNTVCLPNAVTDIEAFFGTGAKAYNFNSYEGGVLGFAETTSMEASYPYIIYVPVAITDDFVLNDFEITYSNRTPGSRYKGTSPNFVYFYGTYAPIAAPNMDGKWGVTDEAKIAKGNASASINGFRGYFTLPDGASARLAFTDEDGTTTVINALELNQNMEGVYNLQGQKVERLQKGLYIVNGRKVVKK